MASKSTPGLLKAIEGYTGEHAGSKEHEPIVSQLKRVVNDIHKGSEPAGKSSPGRAAAEGAASRSFQDRMPAEANHDGGRGNKYSNAPGKAGALEQVADIAGPDGRSDHLTGVAAVKSAGNRQSNLPSSGLPPGTAIRYKADQHINYYRAPALSARHKTRAGAAGFHPRQLLVHTPLRRC